MSQLEESGKPTGKREELAHLSSSPCSREASGEVAGTSRMS